MGTFDKDNDGLISREELLMTQQHNIIEQEDKKHDAQRRMVWVAMSGMLTFPAVIAICEIAGLNNSVSVIGSFAATYFVSVTGIIAAYFVKEGYLGRIDRTKINVSNSRIEQSYTEEIIDDH